MCRPLLFVAGIIAIYSVALLVASPGQAADLNGYNRHVSRSDYRVHRRASSCPDQLSCYPLYGAYGPYGGAGYWGAYSYNSYYSYYR